MNEIELHFGVVRMTYTNEVYTLYASSKEDFDQNLKFVEAL